MATSDNSGAVSAQLLQRLRGEQIFFIVISSIIGTGVFTNNGQALAVAGPAGMLVAVVVLGIIAVFVGETISEFVQVFPAPNGIFEYVHAFVDEELAWVVTVCYWYSYTSIFALQMFVAADLLRYWGQQDSIWSLLVFYGFGPFLLFFLNLSGVWWFGLIETIGGALKTILLIGVTITLYVIAGYNNLRNPINDGFQFREPLVKSTGSAFCLALPVVAYGYVGIEASIVAAFEARPPNGIGWPSRVIHWFTFVCYFACTLGIALTVNWKEPGLRLPYEGILPNSTTAPNLDLDTDSPVTHSAVIIATRNHGAGIINACLIFSVISAGNTALYIASRTLYGLTYRIRGRNILSRQLLKASMLWDFTGVPAMALLWSLIAFYWLPWLSKIENQDAVSKLNTVISITSSIACLIVWAAVCLAFHRYEKWTRLCAEGLKARGYSRFLRDSPEYKRRVWNLLFWLQPWNARIGFIGCIVVFAFASATWWYEDVTILKVVIAYGPQIVMFVCWCILKSYNKWKRGWVWMEVEPIPRKLIQRLQQLDHVSQTAEHRHAYYGSALSQQHSSNETVGNIQSSRANDAFELEESAHTNGHAT
ncbi:amino acid permease-domain-containing protein [Xylariaceae sp. FL0662B]|nr:amino acid permease-domain-containing protein [Xylariaceae sp. FL0662B]